MDQTPCNKKFKYSARVIVSIAFPWLYQEKGPVFRTYRKKHTKIAFIHEILYHLEAMLFLILRNRWGCLYCRSFAEPCGLFSMLSDYIQALSRMPIFTLLRKEGRHLWGTSGFAIYEKTCVPEEKWFGSLFFLDIVMWLKHIICWLKRAFKCFKWHTKVIFASF